MLMNILVFIVVLLVYLHIFYHLKTSNDLEIYENDNMNKNNLEEILNLRQPVLMNRYSSELDILTLNDLCKNYNNYEFNVRKNDIANDSVDKTTMIKSDLLHKLFENDNKYYSEKNEKFLNQSKLLNLLQNNDSLFKPPMTSESTYDLLFGGKGSSTKFKYDINYRNFLYVSDGTVNLKLSPPNNTKYMNLYKDYYNFEFISSINPFLKESEQDMKNISCINITLTKGQLLFIPAYWWYSIQFNNSVIISSQYKTYMNQVTILPEYFMSLMQKQNIKKKSKNKLYKEEVKEYIEKEVKGKEGKETEVKGKEMNEKEKRKKMKKVKNELKEVKEKITK